MPKATVKKSAGRSLPKKSSRRPLPKTPSPKTANRNFHPHVTRIFQHTPTTCTEDIFNEATKAILGSTTTDNVAIIRGIINVDDVFPPTDASHKQDPQIPAPDEVSRSTFQIPTGFGPTTRTSKCIECHIGRSNGTKHYIFDEAHPHWHEVSYDRGDILLVRGDKFHRGTTGASPDTKPRPFLYTLDEALAQDLRASDHADNGAVFCAGLQDVRTWQKRQATLEADIIAESIVGIKASKKAVRDKTSAERIVRNQEHA
jgi:hypothetical protein